MIWCNHRLLLEVTVQDCSAGITLLHAYAVIGQACFLHGQHAVSLGRVASILVLIERHSLLSCLPAHHLQLQGLCVTAFPDACRVKMVPPVQLQRKRQ